MDGAELPREGFFEVGWQYPGFPDESDRILALNQMLDIYGRDPDLWRLNPEIRVVAPHTQPENFGRGPLSVSPAKWAVYGQLFAEPAAPWVREGQLLPLQTERPGHEQ